MNVALDVPGPEARQVGAVAERLVGSLVTETDQARPVRRRSGPLAVVEDLEPDEPARRERRIVADHDDATDLGAVSVVEVEAGDVDVEVERLTLDDLVVLEAAGDAAVRVLARVERERAIPTSTSNGLGSGIVQWALPFADPTAAPDPSAAANGIASSAAIAASPKALRTCMNGLLRMGCANGDFAYSRVPECRRA